jgi:hypothetical protein
MAEKRKITEKDLDDVEHWYELLKDKTFKSKFFALSSEQAKAICEGYTWTKAKRSDPNAALDSAHQKTLEKVRFGLLSKNDFRSPSAFLSSNLFFRLEIFPFGT